jgi:hypothetical protein
MNVSSSLSNSNNNNNSFVDNNEKKKKTNSWWKLINKKFRWHFSNKNNNNIIEKNVDSSASSSELKLIDENYFFNINETSNGLRINLKYPHLTTIIDDSRTLVKIYPLKHGKTTIGSLDSNEIVIKSEDIEGKHCSITYNEDKNEIFLNPFARLCSVDGVIIEKPYKLNFGI